MRTPVFTGACPALVTPFDGHGTINYDAFGKLIDSQIEAGVDRSEERRVGKEC